MGLEQRVFDALKAVLPEHRRCRLLSLGCPDLLLTERLDAPLAKDADKIAGWHNWSGPVYDTDAVFKSLGIDATYIDIVPSRGCELVYDLNQPIKWIAPKFDVVLDPGTSEHVFNIAQAFWTIRTMCLAGGHIIHQNPISAINHGFWNISPTAYRDFYAECGDEVIRAEMLAGPLAAREVYEMPPTARFTAPPNAFSLVVVRRGDQPARGYPMQSKYKHNPDLKAP